jgi:hypothetical protein
MVGQHQATGMILPETFLILELALSDCVGKLRRAVQFVNNQISVHPVTDAMILNHNPAYVEFSGR